MEPVTLGAYLAKQPRGTSSKFAAALGCSAVMVTQWSTGAKPIPEDRAPALEKLTGFVVRCETMCPLTRWVRVPDPRWPHGLPLLDKTPPANSEFVPHVAAATAAPADPDGQQAQAAA